VKKKILFIQTTGNWWDHRYYFKQIPSLMEEGYSVSYMIRSSNDLKNISNELQIFELSEKSSKKARVTGGLNLWRPIKKSKANAVQVCNIELLPLAIFLSIFSRTKVFYDCREDHYHAMLHSKTWYPKLLRYFFGVSVKVLEYITDKTLTGLIISDPALYRLHSGAKKSKKMIFYNMALKKQFKTSKQYKLESTQSRNIDVVVLGSMSVRTGVLDVVNAVASLKKTGLILKLKLIGDPTFDKVLWKQISEIIKRSNIENDISITGRIAYDMIPNELANCKIGIIPLLDIPKFQINMATKQFEYMSSGVAIIASDLNPQKNFLRDNVNALFYKAGNVQELSEKIHYLITNENERLRIINTASKKIYEEWNSESQQIKYKEFYALRLNNRPYLEKQLPPFND
jgi:glycosyltransferase involved in cell wall biosynthesis